MFDALPLEMAFNVSCLRVDYSFSECQMGSMCRICDNLKIKGLNY